MYLSAPSGKWVPPPGKLTFWLFTTIQCWSDFSVARNVWGTLACHTSSLLAGHLIGTCAQVLPLCYLVIMQRPNNRPIFPVSNN
jgi:hypothetical protein